MSGDMAAPIVQKESAPMPSEVESSTPRSLAEGIRFLNKTSILCDVFLVVGEETLPAHQTMLCAMSPAFGKFIREAASELIAQPDSPAPLQAPATTPSPTPAVTTAAVEQKDVEPSEASIAENASKEVQEEPVKMDIDSPQQEKQEVAPKPFKLRVRGVTHPESVKILLDYIYQVGTGGSWEYSPSNLEVNKEILHLSRQFELKHLHEHAARWLTRGVTATNLVERLVICEDFKLGKLREKLIEELTAHPSELSTVCRSAEILAHPRILQELLVQVSSLCGMAPHGNSHRKDSTDEEKVEKTADEVQEKKYEKEKLDKIDRDEKRPESKPLKKKRTA